MILQKLSKSCITGEKKAAAQLWKTATSIFAAYADKTFLPLALLAANTFLPPALLILALKP